MPSWCSQNVIVYAKDYVPNAEIKLEEFIERVNKAISEDKVENGFGKGWLGNILNEFGEYNADTCDSPLGCRFRGQMEVYQLEKYNDSTCNAYTQFHLTHAWSATSMFDKLIEKYYPELAVVWVAEEPGEGLYLSTDVDHRFYDDEVQTEFYLGKDYEHEYMFMKHCKNYLKDEFRSFFVEYDIDIYDEDFVFTQLESIEQCDDDALENIGYEITNILEGIDAEFFLTITPCVYGSVDDFFQGEKDVIKDGMEIIRRKIKHEL